MLLVAGEAGVGKSRLLGQFAEQASLAGVVVAVGGAAPLTGGALPYAPLLQALRALADDHQAAALDAQRVELAGTLAELAGDSPASERLWAPEVGRGRLFERLCGLLDRLGRAAPLVVVLEDLHWADSATLDFLAFLLRTLRGARLLVVGSYRADDPGDPLACWLAEVRRLAGVSWLECTALHPHGTDRATGRPAGWSGGQPGGGGGLRPVGGQSIFRRTAVCGRGRNRRGLACPGCYGRCSWRGCISCRRAASNCCGWRRWPAGGSAMTG